MACTSDAPPFFFRVLAHSLKVAASSEHIVYQEDSAAPHILRPGEFEGAFHIFQALPAVEASLRFGSVFSYNGIE